MPYFAREEERPSYFCPACKGWYVRATALTCLVAHTPGTCCHFGERRVG